MALQAIDQLASQFIVDAVRLKLNALQSMGFKAAQTPGLAAMVADLFNQAMAEPNYPAAVDVANYALNGARQRNMPADIAVATEQLARATAANAEWAMVKPMVARLAADASDSTANLAVGRFYCFTARNWQQGTAALARSSDPIFTWLGRREQTAPLTPDAQLKLANGWWDAAEGQPQPLAAVMRERAAQWYRLAAPGLTGLSSRLAQRRIAKIPAAASLPSPLAPPTPPPAIASIPAPAPAPGPAPISNSGYAPPAPPVAAPPPVAPPPAASGVRTNAGPLAIVVDRASLNHNRIIRITAQVSGNLNLLDPAAQVSIVITDSPAQIIHFIARDFAGNPAVKEQLLAALRNASATADLDAGIAAAIKTGPARMVVLLDGSAALEHLAEVVNREDPNHAVFRTIKIFTSLNTFRTDQKKLADSLRFFGRETAGGYYVESDRHGD
jgi:hypothetical protein